MVYAFRITAAAMPAELFTVRYKVWRSNKDKSLHLRCAEGSEAFNALPAAIRHLGPWTGGAEGDVQRLRLPYRLMLTEQGFTVIYAPVAQLQLESVPGTHALHPANTDCPQEMHRHHRTLHLQVACTAKNWTNF